MLEKDLLDTIVHYLRQGLLVQVRDVDILRAAGTDMVGSLRILSARLLKPVYVDSYAGKTHAILTVWEAS